jgi:hypothetical protein
MPFGLHKPVQKKISQSRKEHKEKFYIDNYSFVAFVSLWENQKPYLGAIITKKIIT